MHGRVRSTTRGWWRDLLDSDDTLESEHLVRGII